MAKQTPGATEQGPRGPGDTILASAQNDLIEACNAVDQATAAMRATRAERDALQAKFEQADSAHMEAKVALENARQNIATAIDTLAGI